MNDIEFKIMKQLSNKKVDGFPKVYKCGVIEE